MLTFQPVTRDDIKEVARTMRAEDKREIAHQGLDPEEVLLRAAGEGHSFTACYRGQAVCIFGVVPDSYLSARACLWLLGSERLEACKLSYFKACKQVVNLFLTKYAVLYNIVDPEYTRAKKWLTRLGAVWGGKYYGGNDVPFDYFEIRRK